MLAKMRMPLHLSNFILLSDIDILSAPICHPSLQIPLLSCQDRRSGLKRPFPAHPLCTSPEKPLFGVQALWVAFRYARFWHKELGRSGSNTKESCQGWTFGKLFWIRAPGIRVAKCQSYFGKTVHSPYSFYPNLYMNISLRSLTFRNSDHRQSNRWP